jgi:protein N-terminal methyltransferase
VPSALKPLKSSLKGRRIRALDVGAGVGRVTCDVLLHLVSDVVLLEPVTPFIQEALTRAKASASDKAAPPNLARKGLAEGSKSVTFVQGTLQDFEPSQPLRNPNVQLLERIGFQSSDDTDSGFDVLWCQWCLGHLSDADLLLFMQRCQSAQRSSDNSLIMVKENVCSDGPDGEPRSAFDEQDSSITRYTLRWDLRL